MIGPTIIVIVLIIAIPVGVLMTGAVLAMALGWMLRHNGEVEHEGSELIEINR